MRLVDYLDSLNWTQTDLAREADISTSTVKRALKAETVSRKNATAICIALTRGMKRPVEMKDVNELHTPKVERGPRKRRLEAVPATPATASNTAAASNPETPR